MSADVPARLLLSPGQAVVEDGAPGGTSLTAAQVQRYIARAGSERRTTRMTAGSRPLGSPEAALQAVDWTENGWGPSLHYFAQARHALLSREHRAPLRAAPLTEVSVPQLLRRRTHRTYARRAADVANRDAIGEMCTLLARWEPAEEISAAVLTYDDGHGAASLRSIGGVRSDDRMLGTASQVRSRMQQAMAGMQAPLTATATVVFVLDLTALSAGLRDDFSFIERLIELGEMAQVIVALGERLGFGALVTPGFSDSQIAEVLALRPSQIALYSVTVGLKRASTPPASIG